MSIYDYIAHKEGVLFTAWGPCFCEEEGAQTCQACVNANEIEAKGLDYGTEYDRAMAARAKEW